MSNPPPTPVNPVNRTNLTRAMIAGGVLGVIAIILFVVLWVVLGNMGLASFARLFLSLCLPPAIIAALLVVYIRVARPRLEKR